ncbi:MAG: recombinase [Clostridiales bacterium]|nr:recombinase [Clostridiales bacterium]
MIDARGLSCPGPVLMVQKAVKEGNPASLEVLVDDKCAVENITRFAKNNGYAVAVADAAGDYSLTLSKK